MSYSSFHNEWYRIARKRHRCELCGGEIEVGEKYSYESGVYDGFFYTRKLHSVCREIIDDYANSELELGEDYTYDYVIDWLRDEFCYECDERENCENVSVCEKMKDYYRKEQQTCSAT